MTGAGQGSATPVLVSRPGLACPVTYSARHVGGGVLTEWAVKRPVFGECLVDADGYYWPIGGHR